MEPSPDISVLDDLPRDPPAPAIRLPPGATLSSHPRANAPPSYQRSTLNAVPINSTLLNKTKLPLALILSPYRSPDVQAPSLAGQQEEEEVPTVADYLIARCRRCRGYINPFVAFIEGGSRWKCAFCSLTNDTPDGFHWNADTRQPANRHDRAELTQSVVEFVAPAEYLLRQPQPPVYVFLIDVSQPAIASGMVATAARIILDSLPRIPNHDGRAKVAIIAVDSALHFFSLPAGGSEPSMMVVSDVDDAFIPQPNDLLVNLVEAMPVIENLLDRLGDIFKDTRAHASALGAALIVSQRLIQSLGGKIMVLTATLPSLGPGALKNREDPKLYGTPREHSLLQAEGGGFYKKFAIDCVPAHVSVDMFLFASAYQDVATLSCVPHYTAGRTFFYPRFNTARTEDALKFAREFSEVLACPLGYEAVLRVRATKGLRTSAYHGNFFERSTDLLALPSVPQDHCYAIELQIEDTINQPFVCIQTALLHTTCTGQRRIRVVTLALPTTSSISEVYASADQIAITNLLAKKAVERVQSNYKLEDARDAIFNKVVDILTAYKTQMTGSSGASPQLSLCENLRLLPLLCLALSKNLAFRHSSQLPSDMRAYALHLLQTLPPQSLIPYIHPKFYCLHAMAPEAGTMTDQGFLMPPAMNLSSQRLEAHGLFLVDDGQNLLLWVGRQAIPELIRDVFDLPSYADLRGGIMTLPTLDNSFSERVNAIINYARSCRRGVYYPHLFVIKDDGEMPLRQLFLHTLIEDRIDNLPSYRNFVDKLKDTVNGNSA